MADGHPWLARALDVMMRPLYPARRLVVPEATGDVLEVGVGTGLNFDLYGDVTSLTGVDPDPHMLARARPRAAALPFPTHLLETGAERMAFPDARFDTAVVTFTLCTIPAPEAALDEVRRVLKPGGRLLFVEHTRSIQPLLGGVQDALTPLWKRLGGGCHLNRRAVELVRAAGFRVRHTEPVWRERWTLLPVYRGVAERTPERSGACVGAGSAQLMEHESHYRRLEHGAERAPRLRRGRAPLDARPRDLASAPRDRHARTARVLRRHSGIRQVSKTRMHELVTQAPPAVIDR